MKIKHWIVVRFFNCELGNHTTKDILSDKMLSMGLQLLKSNLLRSLDNQSCKDFELVLLVHPQLDKSSKWFEELSKLDSQHRFKIDVITSSQQASLTCIKDEDVRIISRVDYDDLILDQVVADTQSFASKHRQKSLMIYGYNYGWVWRDDTCQLYEVDKRYGFGGHFSAMQSVILDVSRVRSFGEDDARKLIQMHPYMWDHSSISNYTSRLPKDLVEREIEVKHNLNLRAYVWMRHKNTGSIDPYKIKADRIQQVKDRKIMDVLDFESHFGKKLNVKV